MTPHEGSATTVRDARTRGERREPPPSPEVAQVPVATGSRRVLAALGIGVEEVRPWPFLEVPVGATLRASA